MMEVNEINKKIEEVERVLKDLDKVMGDATRKKKEVETYLQALIQVKQASTPEQKSKIAVETIQEMEKKPHVDPNKKVGTGVPKIDELLLGGVPLHSNVVLFGPPFTAKEILAYNFVVKSLSENIPVVIIAADKDLGVIKKEISRIMNIGVNALDDFEQKGLLRFIDIYSKTVQLNSPSQYAVQIDSITNLSSIIKAVDTVEEQILEKYPYYRLLFVSLTAFVPQLDEKVFLRFGQQFTQKRRSAPNVSFYLLEEGLFDQEIYQTISYIMDGSVEFKNTNSKQFVRAIGFSRTRTREWVEVYQHNNNFDLGSFSLERVR